MIGGYTRAQIERAEQATGSLLTSGELMRRASTALAEIAGQRLGGQAAKTLNDTTSSAPLPNGSTSSDPAPHDAGPGACVIGLIGPGNNGGDTLFALAQLAQRGCRTWAFTAGPCHEGGRAAALSAGVNFHDVAESAGALFDPAERPYDPTAQPERPSDSASRHTQPECPSASTEQHSSTAQLLQQADLILDGILGLGARPGLPEWGQTLVASIPASTPIIAVDYPSGQGVEGGPINPDAIQATETVTFGGAKTGSLLPPSSLASGRLTLIDIGLTLPEPTIARIEPFDIPSLWPTPSAQDDKYSRGVLGIVAGSETYPGAAVLTCTAAVSAGVGMVRYVGPERPSHLVQAAVPEAVMGEGRCQAWVIGPGVVANDLTTEQREVIDAVWSGESPLVVDAGGLDLLPAYLQRAPLPNGSIITPHAGEAARLLSALGSPTERDHVIEDPLAHAQLLAEKTQTSVLLKGHTTLIAPAPGVDGPVFSQADAPSWLATAGAGDVLAGLLGTLLAAGLNAPIAGATASLLHGRAAHHANPGGPVRALTVAHALAPTLVDLLAK